MNETERVPPKLMAITDIARYGAVHTLGRLAEVCEAAAPGRVWVQLRDRDLGVRERLAVGEKLVELTRRTGQRLIVNDRLDLALLLGADGAHLGEGSVAASDARQLLGKDSIVSRACHRLEQLAEDDLGPVDAVVLSPVFAERKGRPALGVGALDRARRRLARHSRAPTLFALGGVDARVAAELAGSEVAIAAIGAVFDGPLDELVAVLSAGR
jgi:thiamine-phosphate pyrophosphorylase